MGGLRSIVSLGLVLGGIVATAFLFRGMDQRVINPLCAQYAEGRGYTFLESRYNPRMRLFGRLRGYHSCVFVIPQAEGASLTHNIPVWRIPYLPLWGYGFIRYALFIFLMAGLVFLGRLVLGMD